MNVVKAMGKFQPAKFLAGAGASDIEIGRQLAAWGEKTSGLEQYSIAKYAKAFEVIPRALAENAGHDALNLVLLYLYMYMHTQHTHTHTHALAENALNRVCVLVVYTCKHTHTHTNTSHTHVYMEFFWLYRLKIGLSLLISTKIHRIGKSLWVWTDLVDINSNPGIARKKKTQKLRSMCILLLTLVVEAFGP